MTETKKLRDRFKEAVSILAADPRTWDREMLVDLSLEFDSKDRCFSTRFEDGSAFGEYAQGQLPLREMNLTVHHPGRFPWGKLAKEAHEEDPLFRLWTQRNDQYKKCRERMRLVFDEMAKHTEEGFFQDPTGVLNPHR